MPSGWTDSRSGLWFNCSPKTPIAPQGWKIHISGTTHTAIEVLEKVLPIFWETGVHFKCAADRRLLSLINSKTWPRGGSGKFITVYPGPDALTTTIDALYIATRGMAGPFILSDRRYKDSRVIFYRYGGFVLTERLLPNGATEPVILNKEGEPVRDQRNPYFSIPAGVEDPFFTPEDVQNPEEAATLKRGRYKITKALSFSNSGGVYLATDRESGREVVIKEARPLVSWTSESNDAVASLKKEHRILSILQDAGVAPVPYDLFFDWEHAFLAQEFVRGESLWDFGARESILLRIHPTDADVQQFYSRLSGIAIALCNAVSEIHRRGIVLTDLSPHNVIVLDGQADVRIIDYEGSCELGIDVPTTMGTPGFVPPSRDPRRPEATMEDDYYALAATILSCIARVHEFVEAHPGRCHDVVKTVCDAAKIPEVVSVALIRGLSAHREDRSTPIEIARAMAGERPSQGVPPTLSSGKYSVASLTSMTDEMTRFIINSADPERSDRLVPCDYRIYHTNSVGIAYGAAGVLWALSRLGKAAPDGWVDWLHRKQLEYKELPSGFGVGLAGIAWVLWDLGFKDLARKSLREARSRPLVGTTHNLFHGIAGWGLVNLRFYLETHEHEYLDDAVRGAEILMSSASEDSGGLPFWQRDGVTELGLFYGGCGPALFFLYLGLVRKNVSYIEFGRRALDFELAHGVQTADDGLTWAYTTSNNSIISPYWDRGSAGIGAVTLRYIHLAGYDGYKEKLQRIVTGALGRFTYSPAKIFGLTGIAGFLLDVHAFTGDDRHREDILAALDGIMLYRVTTKDGLIFPGSDQKKLSCDYATGSAGIALLLHRIINGGHQEFLLDEYFAPRWQSLNPLCLD